MAIQGVRPNERSRSSILPRHYRNRRDHRIRTDIDALVLQQSDLLGRWWELGTELKRRAYDLPIDIKFEIDELLRLTST